MYECTYVHTYVCTYLNVCITLATYCTVQYTDCICTVCNVDTISTLLQQHTVVCSIHNVSGLKNTFNH